MKKKNFFIMLFTISLLIIFINKLTLNQYNVNIIQYFYKSQPLTNEEKKWLDNHGAIIYGADQNSPPLRYVDNETKQYKGVSVDLIQALSIELGVEIKFKPQVFKDALVSLTNSQIDLFDIFPSVERSKNYLFSDPIYNLRGIILLPANNTSIKTYMDLKGKKVALVNGDYAVEYLNSNVPGVNYYKTDDMQHAIELLMAKKVDCVVGDEPVISYFIASLKFKDNTKIIDKPLYEKGVVLAIPKSEGELLNIINKGVLSIKKKKVAEKIQQKWFGISAPISKDEISNKVLVYIGLGIFLFLLIFYILYYWNEKLKKEVNRQTEELFLSKNDLEIIFDGVTYFMVVVDKNFNILNANRAFCNYAKIIKANVLHMNCSDFPQILYNESTKNLIHQSFSQSTELNLEINVQDKIYEIGTFPLVDKNKKIIKLLLAIKDITELKINEKRLLQSDKMAAVGQLAAGVAHEIRNPLGLIRNYTYLLKKQLEPENKKVSKSINIIETSVDRASSIINNLLNFSRMSSYDKEKINIKEFIQNLLSLESKELDTHDIKLILECSENTICNINLESLKHILINLISNSIDAMEQGGVLKIECYRNPDKLCIIVSDTGIGIDERNLDNIFHPFFTTKPPGKGTGLGLYIAYNEVQKFGGEIKVVSGVDNGTTFTLTLPIGDD